MIFGVHAAFPSCHDPDVQAEEDDELEDLDEISSPGHNQTILVQQRRSSRVIQRDGPLFPTIWDNVDETVGSIHQFAAVNCIHHLLTSTTGQKAFTRAHNGNFKSSQFSLHLAVLLLRRPVDGVGALLADLLGGALEGFKACDEDVGQFEQAPGTRVLFVVPPEDLLGDQFAQQCSGEVDGLMMGGERLFTDELHAIDEKAIHWDVSTT